MEKYIASGKVKLPDDLQSLALLKKQLYEKNWNIYCKKSMAGPQSVVQYLGKYIHRVAISNNRIIDIDNSKVTFRWKDYRNRLTKRLLTLDATEFIGRFMRHVLPSGFYKIRYYGLLAATNGNKRRQCNLLINKPLHVPLLQGLSVRQLLEMVTGKDPDTCPKCKRGKMILIKVLAAHPPAPS